VREAGRVAKPGAPVVIQVWGPHERNDLEAMKQIARPFMPPRPADAPPEPDYAKPGALEDIATDAGLDPGSAFNTTSSYGYADEDTLRRALVAPAGIAGLAGVDREEELIRHRLADDPWARTDRLAITRIQPWNVIVGAERLSALVSRAPTIDRGLIAARLAPPDAPPLRTHRRERLARTTEAPRGEPRRW
jgi:hypothetical protein